MTSIHDDHHLDDYHLDDQTIVAPPASAPPIGELLVSARSFDEYLAMFSLEPADLAGQRVLDCPGGAASFAAGAAEAGAAIISVDPIYARSHDELVAHAHTEAVRGNRYVHENAERFVWSFFRSASDHLRTRLGAVERFDDDRRRVPERYLAGSLPRLPFPDGAFDLAVSSHLLFTYDDRFDLAFHIDAARELARVAREVRIFPTLSMQQQVSAFVAPVVEALRDHGAEVEQREVGYAFQQGPHEMLIARKATATDHLAGQE